MYYSIEVRLHILEAIVEERRRDRRVVLMLEKQKMAAAVGPKKVHRGRSIFVPISPQRSRRIALLRSYAFPSIVAYFILNGLVLG